MSQQGSVLAQKIFVAVKLNDRIDFTSMLGNEFPFVALKPDLILQVQIQVFRQLFFGLLQFLVLPLLILYYFLLLQFFYILLSTVLRRFLFGFFSHFLTFATFGIVLTVFVKHKLEPGLFFGSFLIEFFLNAMHFLDDRLVFGQLVAFIQIVKTQFNIRCFPVDKLKVSLGLFVVGLSCFFDFKRLVCCVNSVFLLVLFGEAGTDIQIQSQEMTVIFLLVVFLALVEVELFVFQILILHIFVRFRNNIPEN